MIIKNIPSIHFNDRKTNIDMLVFHVTALELEEAIKIYDKSGVSAHYIIDDNGNIIQLVDEYKRAWHAGVASWRGVDQDLNSRSIGVEVLNPTMGQSEFLDCQIKSLIDLSKAILERHDIPQYNIVAHSDIAPNRKPDPGICFPWKKLSDENIGVWFNKEMAKHETEEDVKNLLDNIGYNVSDEENIKSSIYAFARRFVPNKVEINNDIDDLIKKPVPDFKIDEFLDEDFINILKAVSFSYR